MCLNPRRVACALYEIKLLLDTAIDPPEDGSCDDYFLVPLPCNRGLWEPVTDGEWETRYQKDVDAKSQHRTQGLNLGDLITLHRGLDQGQELSRPEVPETVGELAQWCEKVDEFGMLLWMATMLEKRSA